MRVEEFEKLTKKELRAKANACFVAVAALNAPAATALMTEARFYLDEINRRADSRVAIRDLILEIVVILLIGGEIALGIVQGKQQEAAFEKMHGVLSSLQTSSEATAKTLTALQKTTESMNGAIQKELSLFYDVSVSTIYSPSDKKLTIANTGRTNITIGGIKVSTGEPQIVPEGRVLIQQATYSIDLASVYDAIVQQGLKDPNGLVPFDVYVKNEKLEEFVIHSYFVVSLKDKATTIVGAQEGSITPQHWPSKKK